MLKLIIAGAILLCCYGVFLEPALGKNLEGPLGTRIRRISCAMGRHERSRRKVRKVEGGYSSYCKYCGVVLTREHGSKRWSTDTRGIIPPAVRGSPGQDNEDLARDEDGPTTGAR